MRGDLTWTDFSDSRGHERHNVWGMDPKKRAKQTRREGLVKSGRLHRYSMFNVESVLSNVLRLG